MATQTSPTIASLQADMEKLLNEIQARGVDASNHAQIVSDAKATLAILDKLQPEINRANKAGFDVKDQVSQLNEYKNKLNSIVAAYS